MLQILQLGVWESVFAGVVIGGLVGLTSRERLLPRRSADGAKAGRPRTCRLNTLRSVLVAGPADSADDSSLTTHPQYVSEMVKPHG